MKRSYNAFKNEYDEGQAVKKRAVIQLIDTTMGGRKKFYSRWSSLTEKSKLVNECKLIANLFASLNFTIKSVSDNAFSETKENVLKEKALIQLFKNLSGNMSDCFRRWRDVNAIEKLRARLTDQQKLAVINVLESMIKGGRNTQLREIINKFRLNRRLVEIQRNFLKRLLMSKAGLVVIAFKKFISLPERAKERADYSKLLKFEKGLVEVWNNTCLLYTSDAADE